MSFLHRLKVILKRALPQNLVSLILKMKWERMKEIDLSKIDLVRKMQVTELANSLVLEEKLLPQLGLNNEALYQMPDELFSYTGQGLLYWQYPVQFSKYLVLLSKLKVESYLEIGVRHGGTFIITVEYLQKFHPLKKAVGVELGYSPSVVAYSKQNKKVRFFQADSQTERFKDLLQREVYFDLVLIDGNHEETECRNDYDAVKDRAGIIVLHDIASVICPGVQKLWSELKQGEGFIFYEFTEQYQSVIKRTGQAFFGIGVAVSKSYLSRKEINCAAE
ncbi:MAG TPA: class I SAM-dependent methyltransferase [Flavisolibacter sp.]|jgi:SAM-dependent methyltransferase|nr:class I SAM-dependent methyltransferase [Flavisolibacter sp.]